MSILNFREILPANSSDGMQDTFELFARDFLEYLGYRITSGPNRGPDRGKDLVAKESRIGISGETIINWLVSCKHNAHSGKSVSPQDEQNIRDRLEQHDCGGFLGVYSTLPSSGLSDILEGTKKSNEVAIYDWAKIEKLLLDTAEGIFLAQRYFPNSVRKWKIENAQLSPEAVTTIKGKPLTDPNPLPIRNASVFDFIIWENDVSQLFFKYNDFGVAELYCRSGSSIAHLFNFSLSEADRTTLKDGAIPDLWTYYEVVPESNEVWGILKFQYLVGSEGVVSAYRINYTKRELLITKLREFVNDWDEVAEG